MGYHAPSAEEVYRYALRLDHHRSSLTDRFGWSIVLVNDNSPACREFLQTYCMELCFRTADRIRFVFFSDIPREEIDAVAEQLNRGIIPTSQGLLRNILSRLDWRGDHRRFDYEFEPWRRLRPPPLHPLRTAKEIERQLNWECEMKTAMPGVGIAMQFAQRLGIGRFVPCVLIFTEVGTAQVDVLSIAGLPPEQVYSHVRGWIDDFYEINHHELDRWRAIEDQIESLSNEANQSLAQLRQWREKRLQAWNNLRTASEMINTLEKRERLQWHAVCKPVAESYALPNDLRQIAIDLLRALEELRKREALAQQLRTKANRLDKLQTLGAIVHELSGYESEGLGKLLNELSPVVAGALADLHQRTEAAQGAQVELYAWWNRYCRRRLPAKRFKKTRDDWIHLAGKDGRVIKDEFNVVLLALRSLPLATDPDHGVGVVLDALAAHYGVDPAFEPWRASTATYRGCVKDYLQEVCGTAPLWVKSELSELPIGEALPPSDDTSPGWLDRFLNAKSEIRDALNRVLAKEDEGLAQIVREGEDAARSWQAKIATMLRVGAASFEATSADWQRAADDALAQLRPRRKTLEKHAYEQGKADAGFPGSTFDHRLAEQLHRALDEYDTVVGTIRYPHQADPMVQTVYMTAPAPVAIGLKDSGRAVNRSTELRHSLQAAFDTERQSRVLWPKVRAEVLTASPAARLSEALTTAVGEDRLSALFHKRGKSVLEELETALLQHRVAEILQLLGSDELSAVASAIWNDGKNVPALGTEDSIDRILVGLGIYAGARSREKTSVGADDIVERLREKIATDDFDVFMAHNSLDKAAVLEVCRWLRSSGVYPWVDIEQIPPGRWFQDVIQSIVPKVKAAAIFLGPRGLGRWQALEIRSFVSQCVERALPVIPVLLPSVKEFPSELIFLRELNYVRFESGVDEIRPLQGLLWGITGKKP